ncbi:MAG: hypothetical protein ACE5PV_14280 [Candidatus Poribacteria bacterium]
MASEEIQSTHYIGKILPDGHLESLPLFCQRLYEAIEWLDKNKI